MNITEKASYLCGLMEGMNLDTTTNEGKMIDKLVDLISDMADEIAELEEKIATLNDYVEELDEDLGDVEELLCEDDEFECEDCDQDCDNCDCECDDDFYEVECPSCGETVCFDDSIDPSSVICPACGEKFDCTCTADDCESCEGCKD